MSVVGLGLGNDVHAAALCVRVYVCPSLPAGLTLR